MLKCDDLLLLAERDRKLCRLVEGDFPEEYAVSAAAFHMQQAIEKTIKLKAYVHGIDDIWGHDIRALINWCKKKDSFHLIHSSDVSRKEDSHETDNELSNRAE